MKRLAILLVVGALVAGAVWFVRAGAPGGPAVLAAAPRPASGAPAVFEDAAAVAGITTVITYGSREKHYLPEINGAGAALLDYDGDGLLDVYLVNGSTFEFAALGVGPGNVLYRNLGDGRFEDVTAAAGVGDTGWGQGCAAADYDNDGDTDLYVTNWGPDVLYRNEGNGIFAEVAAEAGVADPLWGASAAFGDYDRDGDLDLYVTRYARFDTARIADYQPGTLCPLWGGVAPVACGPRGFPAEPDVLYRNEGDGRFRDVTESAGIPVAGAYFGLAATFVDADGDGWPDIYVVNDADRNLLFRNRGNGRFEEVGVTAGVAYDGAGNAGSGMGIDVGDLDGDGLPDLYVTNFTDKLDTFYRNLGGGRFQDDTEVAGLARESLPYMKWGCRSLDYDNDGWLDLYVAAGHLYPQVEHMENERAGYGQRNLLYRNLGEGRFSPVFDEAGSGLLLRRVSRGVAVGDLDNDGDLDIVVTEVDTPPSVLLNRGTGGHFLGIRLEGTRSSRDGTGARVAVEVAGRRLVRWANPHLSFQSSQDPRIHVGLGAATRVEAVTVHWPSGRVDRWPGLPADRYYHLREGEAPAGPTR